MPQYGFFFDQSRCTGCHVCAVACKEWNFLSPGPVKWMRVFEWETGSFPSLELHHLAAPCFHCENPACVDAANGAMYKEGKYGAVLIDPSKATSADMRAAWKACPYGAIVFDSDAPDAQASSCTMCIDRISQGMMPACVGACAFRALDFGPLEELQTKYGTSRDLEGLPDSATTHPAVVFKPTSPRQQIVPYDVSKALQLLANRDPYPPFYTNPNDVTEIPDGLIRHRTLVIKPKTTRELLDVTQHDEG